MTAPFALPLSTEGSYVTDADGSLMAVSFWSPNCDNAANRARYIARAVTLHERLVEALTKAETFITDCEWSITDPDWDIRADGIVLELRELLREAEAE